MRLTLTPPSALALARARPPLLLGARAAASSSSAAAASASSSSSSSSSSTWTAQQQQPGKPEPNETTTTRRGASTLAAAAPRQVQPIASEWLRTAVLPVLDSLRAQLGGAADVDTTAVQNVEIDALATRLAQEEERHRATTRELLKMEAAVREAETRIASLTTRAMEMETRATTEATEAKRLASRMRELTHPNYGQLLLDLGPRRIFAADAKRVVNPDMFPVWSRNRLFRPERAEQIAKSFAKTSGVERYKGFPGCLTVFELVGDAAAATKGVEWRGIVDGQHRVGAIARMLKSGEWPSSLPVMLEVFSVDKPEDASQLFRQINLAVPVPDIDMPAAAAAASTSVVVEAKTVADPKPRIDAVADAWRARFPEFFKPSAKCRPPHVNIDVFRQTLFESDAARAAASAGEAELSAFVEAANEKAKAAAQAKSSGVPVVGWEKAHAGGFFLGLSVARVCLE